MAANHPGCLAAPLAAVAVTAVAGLLQDASMRRRRRRREGEEDGGPDEQRSSSTVAVVATAVLALVVALVWRWWWLQDRGRPPAFCESLCGGGDRVRACLQRCSRYRLLRRRWDGEVPW